MNISVQQLSDNDTARYREQREIYRRFGNTLQQLGYRGDILFDHGNRTVYSTDNSIYQRFPQAVLCPRDNADVVLIAELSQRKEFRPLAFCARGGGTGTNGQALSDGIIVDFSKHMNKILEINAQQRRARVQAGVVKDQLNAAVREHGLFFAPDLSTSNRATIGGMINTDASGQGSCKYGKTRDHIIALHTVFGDGSEWTSTTVDDEALAAICARQDRIGQVHRIIDNIYKEQQHNIARIFPPLNRCLTGYDLAHIRTAEQCFDLNSILCGSEGTLGFVTEAVVNLEVIPQQHALVVLQYDDFIAALADARRIMAFQPTAIETVDATVVKLAQDDMVWDSVAGFFPKDQRGPLAAVNLVEFSGNDERELQQSIHGLQEDCEQALAEDSSLTGYHATFDADEMSALWSMRKRSVGLLGNLRGEARPIPFVEDAAVPPEHLASFIAEFRQLLDQHQLQYGMFGHVDAGVIHVRPALDTRDPATLRLIRQITDQVYVLTEKYGGVLWGEHGKGVRSEFAPRRFGELYPQLQRIKAAFDPSNQLNPGKIATPSAELTLLAIDNVPTRGERDRHIPDPLWQDYGDAMHCNGNGACFNWDPTDTMCPSWKVTRDRQFSPKGRASLLREWLYRESRAGRRPFRSPSQSTTSSPSLWRRWLDSLRRRRSMNSDEDFADQVRRSMDECLACKACVSQCPVHVDVPAFRSAFYYHYYRERPRPLRHYLIHYLERMLPLMVRSPRLYNLLTQSRPSQAIIKRGVGMCALPPMSKVNLSVALRRLGIPLATRFALSQLSPEERAKAVVLVQDVFTRYFEPQLIVDSLSLLQCLGFKPLLAPFIANGKPSHVLGFLDQFNTIAAHADARLSELATTGVPLVGLEPSMTLTYRSEYRQALGKQCATEVLLIQEWLAQQRKHLYEQRHLFKPGTFTLLPHCTEATVAAASLAAWRAVFKTLEQELTIESVGCCGMAGTYGHELCRQQSSERLFQMSWQPTLQAAAHRDKPSIALASGFSCRQQAARFGHNNLPHPLQALRKQLIE